MRRCLQRRTVTRIAVLLIAVYVIIAAMLMMNVNLDDGIPTNAVTHTLPQSLSSSDSSYVHSTVILSGVAKDIAPEQIHNIVPKLRALGSKFRRYQIVIYENNSKQDSRNAWLGAFSKMAKEDAVTSQNGTWTLTQGADYLFISEDISLAGRGTRTQRLALARNNLLHAVHNHANRLSRDKYEYWIVTDLDGVCGGADHTLTYSPSIFREALDGDHKNQWDALSFVFVPYFDLWAFRHPDVMPHNHFSQNKTRNQIKSSSDMQPWINSKNRSNLIEVDSAFMMLSIYRLNMTVGCAYSGIGEYGDKDCEHVPFHRDMRHNNGARVRLWPVPYCQGDKGFPEKYRLLDESTENIGINKPNPIAIVIQQDDPSSLEVPRSSKVSDVGIHRKDTFEDNIQPMVDGSVANQKNPNEAIWVPPLYPAFVALGRVSRGFTYQMDFLCQNNDVVYLFTNIKTDIKVSPCVQVIVMDTSGINVPWQPFYKRSEFVFVRRWYYIYESMKTRGISHILHFDADQLVFANTTAWMIENIEVLNTNRFWGGYEPPHTSWHMALLNVDVLGDILQVFDALIGGEDPLYGKKHANGPHKPNDMELLSYYVYLSEGNHHPCWSRYVSPDPLAPSPPPNTCGESFASDIIAGLHNRSIVAKYTPGPMEHYFHKPNFTSYFVKKELASATDTFRVAYHEGKPYQFREGGVWIPLAGYLVEDKEQCMTHHIGNVISKRTCQCTTTCCESCIEWIPFGAGKW